MDADLRDLLRRAKQEATLQGRARVALQRAGYEYEDQRDSVLAALHWAFVDQLDYASVELGTVKVLLDTESSAPPKIETTSFTARMRSGTVTTVDVWLPSIDEILTAGGALDIRVSVCAPARERSLTIETVQEALPGAVVMSRAAAGGAQPPKVPTRLPVVDAEWRPESMRVHVRG